MVLCMDLSKVMVVGNGYVGSGFVSAGCKLGRSSIPDLDGVKYLINCVGYKGENVEKAHELNVEYPLFLSRLCRESDVKLIHISTAKALYESYDPYPKSKRYGDWLVLREASDFTTYHLPWLFKRNGDDFIRTVRRAIDTGSEVTIREEVGSPTYLDDAVKYILDNLDNNRYMSVCVANSYETSRLGYFEEICRLLCRRAPHKTEEDNEDNLCRVKGTIAWLRPWREALTECIENYDE